MKSQRPLESVSIYLLLALIGATTADLLILSLREKMLPTAPPHAQKSTVFQTRSPAPSSTNYAGVINRNIFNADQKIPDPLNSSGGPQRPNADPVPTSLPVQLVGTIVHVNPLRSVATLLLKNKSDQLALKVNDIVPDNMATITRIERNKVIFRNNVTQILEYIEIAEDSKILFGSASPKPQQIGEVLKRSETEFELNRSDINRLTSNLQDVLQQARAVPRISADGQVECFSIADMQPGSIYERLGLRRGDCIKAVNGEKIDNPTKALELYNRLKSGAASISLGVERNGQDENFSYTITN